MGQVSGVYEGGFRVWEASIDLVKYMAAHREVLRLDAKKKGAKGKGKKSDNRPLRCLELG